MTFTSKRKRPVE